MEFVEKVGDYFIYLDCIIPDGTDNPVISHSMGALSYGFEDYQ